MTEDTKTSPPPPPPAATRLIITIPALKTLRTNSERATTHWSTTNTTTTATNNNHSSNSSNNRNSGTGRRSGRGRAKRTMPDTSSSSAVAAAASAKATASPSAAVAAAAAASTKAASTKAASPSVAAASTKATSATAAIHRSTSLPPLSSLSRVHRQTAKTFTQTRRRSPRVARVASTSTTPATTAITTVTENTPSTVLHEKQTKETSETTWHSSSFVSSAIENTNTNTNANTNTNTNTNGETNGHSITSNSTTPALTHHINGEVATTSMKVSLSNGNHVETEKRTSFYRKPGRRQCIKLVNGLTNNVVTTTTATTATLDSPVVTATTATTTATPTPTANGYSSLEVSPSPVMRTTSLPTPSSLSQNQGITMSATMTSNGTTATLQETEKKPSRRTASRVLRSQFDYTKLATDHNHDTCDACGGEGKFLCCDACPAAFHFGCMDPPVSPDAVPEGDWYCTRCRLAKGLSPIIQTMPSEQMAGPFQGLIDQLNGQNPKMFRLPYDIRSIFKGVGSNSVGEYVDLNETKTNREIAESDINQLKSSNGQIRLCFTCRKSALQGPMVSCDYCPLHWHMDCISPPMASPPNPHRRWMCPNHADHVTLGKRKRQFRQETSLTVDDPLMPNDGNIDIALHDTSEFHEIPSNHGVRYRIPAWSVKLGFIRAAHARRPLLHEKEDVYLPDPLKKSIEDASIETAKFTLQEFEIAQWLAEQRVLHSNSSNSNVDDATVTTSNDHNNCINGSNHLDACENKNQNQSITTVVEDHSMDICDANSLDVNAISSTKTI